MSDFDLPTILALLGSITILVGYLRLITEDNGNVPLLQYRLTGCIGLVVTGMMMGVQDLLHGDLTSEAVSTLLILFGISAFIFVFSAFG